MSGNGKQVPSPANQQARFSSSPYPFAQQPSAPAGSDTFHVTTPPAGFAPPPGAAQAGQGPSALRGMAPAAPPTPPQTDIKMQPQQQMPLAGHSFVPQQGPNTRGTQGSYGPYRPPPPQPQGAPRMQSHHRQQIYPQPGPLSMYSGPIQHPQMMFTAPQMLPQAHYGPRQTTPQYYQGTMPTYQAQLMNSQHPIATYSFSGQQPQQYYYASPGGAPLIQSRTVPPGASVQQQAAPVVTPHQQPPMPMQGAAVTQQQNAAQQAAQAAKKQRRMNAIKIVDPKTGKDVLDEMMDEKSPNHSGDSSERQTPQPANQTGPSDMEVVAEFAKRVALAANEDIEEGIKSIETSSLQTVIVEFNNDANIEPKSIPNAKVSSADIQLNHQGLSNICIKSDTIEADLKADVIKNDTLLDKSDDKIVKLELSISESKLQVTTREFVPEQLQSHGQRIPVIINQAIVGGGNNQQTTPVVSAITDGPSVDILPKPSKTLKHNVSSSSPITPESPKTTNKKSSKLEPSNSAPAFVEAKVVADVKPPSGKDAGKPKRISESDNKNSKSESKKDTIVPKSSEKPNGPEAVAAVIDNSNNAKNSKKENQPAKQSLANSTSVPSKEPPVPKPLQQQKQQSVPVSTPVPQPQPPKPGNKSQKMKDLNRKGAEKQAHASDMDAFSTTTTTSTTVNNTNSIEPPEVETPVEEDIHLTNSTSNSVVQPIIVPELKEINVTGNGKPKETTKSVLPKTLDGPRKVDVTSIVKQNDVIPKITPPKRETPPKDELDRVTSISSEEEIVKAKNEENRAKSEEVQSENNVITDGKPALKYSYKEDQWSPLNLEGKKCYDRDFLVALGEDPKSKIKPDNLPDIEVVLKEGSNRQLSRETPRFAPSMNRQHEALFPGFVKSQSQRGFPPQPVPKRNSQQGKPNQKAAKPGVIHVSLSLRDEVKLHETENAWKPAHLKQVAMTTEEKKTHELYKKVRGVLNKLTPQKFETLVSQVRDLSIDNSERLKGVIELVFEKAIDEPSFSVAYAYMCRELAMMQVPAERKSDSDPEFVNFRKLLVTRCQLEFEKNTVDEGARAAKLKEIDECPDPEKKKELQHNLDEDERRLRVKSVGNVRFIGELFKQGMLTVNIMLRCLRLLLETIEEESLECLCKLLTTIGRDLEKEKKQNLQNFFDSMQDIVDRKRGKISSRVRFMLQDVIELRHNEWKPRHNDTNPKTMDQIQKEAETEQLNIQMMNSNPMQTPRKDDRRGGGGSGGASERKRGNMVSDDGWSTAGGQRGSRTTYQVDTSKLRTAKPVCATEEIQLGKPQYGNWTRGSNIKQMPQASAANKFALLENISDDKRPMSGSRPSSKDTSYHSKGPSMERYKSYDENRSSRSGSQHRSRENSSSRGHASLHTGGGRSQPLLPPTQPRTNVLSAPISKAAVQELSKVDISEEQIDKISKKMGNIIDEFANQDLKVEECEREMKELFSLNQLYACVRESFNHVLEKSQKARQATAQLFAYLVKNGTLPVQSYLWGVGDILEYAEDLMVDIPKVWEYFAELIAPVVLAEGITLNHLHSIMGSSLISKKLGGEFIAPIFQYIVREKNPNFVQELWSKSELSWSDFMDDELVNDFIKKKDLSYVSGEIANTSNGGSRASPTNENIHEKLTQFLKLDETFPNITAWITVQVGNKVTDPMFIRTLTTAVIEHSIHQTNSTYVFNPETLTNSYRLLTHYIGSNEELQLQCLYAIQSLIHRLEHPQGVLVLVFEKLWEDSIIGQQSFLTWRDSSDPAESEGKGVAEKTLVSFFTALLEASGDDESSPEE